MVSDISDKILEITAEHPTVKSLVIHTGALDVVKQQSEVLKWDFNDLLNKVRCLNTEVFISGPLPTVWRGDERFSRLLMLNRWLKDTCAAQSVNFIDNFNIFWERRHLFEADGFCLNKSGVQLLSYNIFDFLRQSPAAPAKDKRRDNPKQQIRQPSGEKLLPPEIRIDHEGQHTESEALTSSSLPQHEEFPPAPTAQNEESPPAPTTQQEESPPAPTAQQVESPPAPPGDSQLSPTGTPSSLSFSPRSLDSPFPHFLDFTDRMNDLKKTAAVFFFFFFSSAAVRRDRLWVGLEGFGGEGGRRLRPLALQRPPAPTSPLPRAVDAVSRCAFLPPHGGWGRGPLAPGMTVDRDGLSSVRPNRVASSRAGIRLTYNWRKGSAAMSATHPTRLETRTKESNACASQRVLRNPAAQ
ncbi:hypothetical protein N1851_027107 [Merluccius polli]|uniref:Uncharacterized protein n=1 Tax=Merluccius polli TaxID=89951 RepID=A0AA47MAX3_MERPO|nr:hypothetical protein N1851_027107 [Merluccius polli]